MDASSTPARLHSRLHRSAAREDAGMRRVTAPRVISAGGTGGERSRGVYCVQLGLGGAQQSGGRWTDERLQLQLAAVTPA